VDNFIKRSFDFIVSLISLVLLIPFFFIIAIVIRLDSTGPVFFRQVRIGQYGIPFHIHKFRTMIVDAEIKGLQVTVRKDPRITRVGNFLRQYKLDELPQLFDVFIGKMSLVGPRPEVPKYIVNYSPEIRDIVFSVKPGITDNASILYYSENDLLTMSNNPEKVYLEEILPKKLQSYVDYVKHQTFWGDIEIILKTLMLLIKKRK
jgi:lipopolysaccharide/colanic/teichoic acid biosynthesis glycosyltransferase